MSEIEPRVPLDILDPAHEDPGYWVRFRAKVMTAVRPSLIDRQAQVSMEGIIFSWGRLIVPLTAAAVLAAIVVPSSVGPASEGIAGVEEVLEIPIDGEPPLPYFLHSDQQVDRDVVLFALETR